MIFILLEANQIVEVREEHLTQGTHHELGPDGNTPALLLYNYIND